MTVRTGLFMDGTNSTVACLKVCANSSLICQRVSKYSAAIHESAYWRRRSRHALGLKLSNLLCSLKIAGTRDRLSHATRLSASRRDAIGTEIADCAIDMQIGLEQDTLN